MKKFNWIVMFGIMVAFAPTAAFSEQPAGDVVEVEIETIDLGSITCRDFLKFGGDEEKSIITFLHGYISGTQNNTVIDLEAFGDASDKITDMCIDGPNQPLLNVFKANR